MVQALQHAPSIETLRKARERRRMGAAEGGNRESPKQDSGGSVGAPKKFIASLLKSTASLVDSSDPKNTLKMKIGEVKTALEVLTNPDHGAQYGEILEFQVDAFGSKQLPVAL